MENLFMKFLHKDSSCINITDDITLYEYCGDEAKLPIDGAYALINGSYGPKINKTFSELFLEALEHQLPYLPRPFTKDASCHPLPFLPYSFLTVRP